MVIQPMNTATILFKDRLAIDKIIGYLITNDPDPDGAIEQRIVFYAEYCGGMDPSNMFELVAPDNVMGPVATLFRLASVTPFKDGITSFEFVGTITLE